MSILLQFSQLFTTFYTICTRFHPFFNGVFFKPFFAPVPSLFPKKGELIFGLGCHFWYPINKYKDES